MHPDTSTSLRVLKTARSTRGRGARPSCSPMRGARRAILLGMIVAHATSAPTLISELPDVEDEDDEEGVQGFAYEDDEPYEGMEVGIDGFYSEHEDVFGDLGPEEMRSEITTLFQRLDVDKDGTLTQMELRSGLRHQAAEYKKWNSENDQAEAARTVAEADGDQDGKLSRGEFDQADIYLPYEGTVPREQLFSFADADADGLLGEDEVATLVFPDSSPRQADLRAFLAAYMLKTHDADNDGFLSPIELWRSQATGGGADEWPEGAGGGAWSNQRHHNVRDGEEGGGDDAWGELDRNQEPDPAVMNEMMSAHDENEDGKLDAGEIADYVAPDSSMLHNGYVEEEIDRVMHVLSGGNPDANSYQRVQAEPTASFDLDAVVAAGVGFLHTFSLLAHEIRDNGAGDESEQREEL